MTEGELPRAGRSASWYFGSGGVASGVISSANYFVLIYSNQVPDLSGSLAGPALAISANPWASVLLPERLFPTAEKRFIRSSTFRYFAGFPIEYRDQR